MASDPIKAALDAAATKLIMKRGEHASWSEAHADATHAIVAFLLAMNPHGRRAGYNLAAAVEEAARDA